MGFFVGGALKQFFFFLFCDSIHSPLSSSQVLALYYFFLGLGELSASTTTLKTAAERLYSEFMLRFDLPDNILHDQSGETKNYLFQELAKLCGVKKIKTTPYHQQTSEKVEHLNQTIISMLQTFPELDKRKCKDHIEKLVFEYNCTKHSRTEYSPNFLLFGRHRKLPIDIVLPTDCHIKGTHKNYSNKWKEQMKEAYKVVSKQRKNKYIEHRNSFLQGFHKVSNQVIVF